MKDDSILTTFFKLLFKVIVFVAYCFGKIIEHIVVALNNAMKSSIKK